MHVPYVAKEEELTFYVQGNESLVYALNCSQLVIYHVITIFGDVFSAFKMLTFFKCQKIFDCILGNYNLNIYRLFLLLKNVAALGGSLKG